MRVLGSIEAVAFLPSPARSEGQVSNARQVGDAKGMGRTAAPDQGVGLDKGRIRGEVRDGRWRRRQGGASSTLVGLEVVTGG